MKSLISWVSLVNLLWILPFWWVESAVVQSSNYLKLTYVQDPPLKDWTDKILLMTTTKVR
jgi:hypothetical protein